MSDEKIIGFRMPKKDESRLKRDLYYQNISKKEWLGTQLTIRESIEDLSVVNNERWLRVPASEYEQLHGTDPVHHDFIYARIFEHCLSESIPITFDNLMNDVMSFCKMNEIQITRFDDEGREIIHIKHNIGKNYSQFLGNMISKMVICTNEYSLSNVDVHDTNLTIKISKK